MFGCLLFFQQGWLMNTKECAVFHSKYKESAASFPQASENKANYPKQSYLTGPSQQCWFLQHPR